MIAKAIEAIKALAQGAATATQFTIGDRTYTDIPLTEVPNSLPELAKGVGCSTLGGLVDLINGNVESYTKDAVILHVVSHARVELASRTSDKWGRRCVLASANMPHVNLYEFGKYVDHESFMIALQAGFVATPDRDYLLNVAANVTAEAVVNSEDNGIAQKVGMRKGVALKTTEVLKSRVTLAPFRTFREIEQPASEFIFRVKQEGSEIPRMALFEADGGKWKIDAMETLGRYMRAAVTDIPVIV